jgi:uncharacterized membrane protein YqaE (UPF0057 family)
MVGFIAQARDRGSILWRHRKSPLGGLAWLVASCSWSPTDLMPDVRGTAYGALTMFAAILLTSKPPLKRVFLKLMVGTRLELIDICFYLSGYLPHLIPGDANSFPNDVQTVFTMHVLIFYYFPFVRSQW